MELVKLALPSFFGFLSGIIVALINNKGKKQKTLIDTISVLETSQKVMKKDIEELKKDMKEVHIYIGETVKVLTTAFDEHKDKGTFNGETTQAIRHFQHTLADIAINN